MIWAANNFDTLFDDRDLYGGIVNYGGDQFYDGGADKKVDKTVIPEQPFLDLDISIVLSMTIPYGW